VYLSLSLSSFLTAYFSRSDSLYISVRYENCGHTAADEDMVTTDSL